MIKPAEWYGLGLNMCFLALTFKLVSLVAQICSTLRPHELQHAKFPYPSPTPRACSNSFKIEGSVFLRNHLTVLHSGCTNIHSHQQYGLPLWLSW